MARPSKRVSKTRRVAQAALQAADQFDNPMLAEMYAWAMDQYEEGNKDPLRFLQQLDSVPDERAPADLQKGFAFAVDRLRRPTVAGRDDRGNLHGGFLQHGGRGYGFGESKRAEP